MSLGKRQLFLYWRVGAVDAALACAAMRRWQRKLQAQYPALQTRLFSRVPTGGDELTYMESYALEAGTSSEGIEPPLQRVIEHDGHAAVQRWLRGARHVELFEDCGD